ncbi:MAG: RagB/SusD family nutrient uptake outer membrane protein [Cyclobacteriaceae bacterium]
MKTLNNIYRIAALFIAITLGSCSEDFLDLPPQNNGTVGQFYSSQADFETAVVGLYSGFSGAIIELQMLEEYRGDNLTNIQYHYLELAENQFGPNTTNMFWSLYTELVYPANTILDRVDEVDMDASASDRIKGQAYFFRGFAYYTLNLWFGGVPSVTEPLGVDESYTLGRSSEAEIWALAESDFSQAVSLLDPSVEIGRVDKYDAEAYLAKTLMQQQKWGEAETALADVFNNSGAVLEPSWDNLWSMDVEKSSPEYMLSVVLSPAAPANNWAQQFLYMENTPGLQGNFRYKPGYYESFETGDLRRDATLGYTPNQLREENRKYDFGYDLSEFRYIGDLVVLRFADVQLLYAEAISMNAGSPQQESLDLMNETRNRAGLSPLNLGDVPTLDDFVTAILAERRAELAFEGHRYSDLKRQDKLVEYINALGGVYNFDNTYNYVPIPQQEIDKVGSDILAQNDGY